jgi:glycosyltransferase involved in cell wall biosynthesis
MEQEKKAFDCLVLASSSSSVLYFRTMLIRWLIAKGQSVLVSCSDDVHREEIEDLGAGFSFYPFSNRSSSPFQSLSYQRYLEKLILFTSPCFILTFQAKSNIFGNFASRRVRSSAPVISLIEGLGDPFIRNDSKWKLIRMFELELYKRSLSNAKRVFFLNQDDEQLFLNKKVVLSSKADVIHGIGVDLEKFSKSKISNYHTVLMASRLLKTKGVFDYCKAAEMAKKERPDIEFVLAGPEGDITKADISYFINSRIVTYMGPVEDMVDLYKRATIFVLPSSREGFPMTIMEAMASGRPIITNNVPGCRDAVDNGINGILVPKGDSSILSSEILKLISDKDLCTKYGDSAREKAAKSFSFPSCQERYLNFVMRYLK